MCTTFYIDIEEDELREICREIENNQNITIQSGNVRQNRIAPVLAPDVQGSLNPRAMTWGFPAEFTEKDSKTGKLKKTKKTLVNTRVETAANLKTWKDAMNNRRIIIPMTGFYEGRRGADHKWHSYYFKNPNGGLLYAAGIYDYFEPIKDRLAERFSILTMNPEGNIVGKYHDRMPLILQASEKSLWLQGVAVGEWLVPRPDDMLEVTEAS